MSSKSDHLLEGERLKVIPGYPQYFISDFGTVINAKTKKPQRLLRSNKQKAKLKVALSMNKVVKVFYVHRLVAQAFLDDYEENRSVVHINKNYVDNWVGNLRMGDVVKDENNAQAQARDHRVVVTDGVLQVSGMRPKPSMVPGRNLSGNGPRPQLGSPRS